MLLCIVYHTELFNVVFSFKLLPVCSQISAFIREQVPKQGEKPSAFQEFKGSRMELKLQVLQEDTVIVFSVCILYAGTKAYRKWQIFIQLLFILRTSLMFNSISFSSCS